MTTLVPIPPHSEDDALARIVEWLKPPRQRSYPQSSADLHLPDLLHSLMNEVRQQNPAFQHAGGYMRDPSSDVAAFDAAAWHLVSRGVLVPIRQDPDSRVPFGDSFRLTEYGTRWIELMSGFEWHPMEHGRFAQLLLARAERFGNAFRVRSQEAAACYRAHTYLACCTMCGAAAEAILLALAIAHSGDEIETLREYRRSDGRSRIEKRLLHGQNSYVHQQLPQFLELLKYWRDDAAHGADAEISEEVAFVSLLLLLRFAAFADDRWESLTARDSRRE